MEKTLRRLRVLGLLSILVGLTVYQAPWGQAADPRLSKLEKFEPTARRTQKPGGRFNLLNTLITSADQAPLPGWEITCLECPKLFASMSDRSLRLDQYGRPHLAYGSDHLYYAWHDGVIWHYETADSSPGVGAYTALALDDSGAAHISYFDNFNEVLKYAYQDGSGWHTETVEAAAGWSSSIALDDAGRPHLVYTTIDYSAPNELRYAYREATGWHTEVVDTDGNAPSLTLDDQGMPHISYGAGDTVKYASRGGLAWQIEILGSAGYPSAATSIALDHQGDPHISYTTVENKLMYSHKNAAGWTHEWVASGGWGDVSLALDNQDAPHISFMKCTRTHYPPSSCVAFAVEYHYKDGPGWISELLSFTDLDESLSSPSLAILETHVPQLIFINESKDTIIYASKNSGSWQHEVVDEADDVGWYPQLQVDSRDQPHLVSSDPREHEYGYDLKYTYLDPSGWHTEIIAGGWVSGGDLELDQSGAPHLLYRDFGRGELVYVHYEPSAWITETLIAADNLRAYALALDTQDHPHLAYTQYTPLYSLNYAYQDQTGWLTETVATGSYITYISMAVDSAGYPHIGYFNRPNVMYTYLDPAGWHTQVVDSGSEFDFVSLILDPQDFPHLSYSDFLNAVLKYAYQDQSGWHTEIVDYPAFGGGFISLGIDPKGFPHISYYEDSPHYDLKYAYKDAYGWHLQLVDSTGSYNSIAVDSQGTAHIGYYDYYTADLKYAYTIPALTIDGPAVSLIGFPYQFTAQITSPSTTSPLEYVWEATNQNPITHTHGLSDTVSYTWPLTGTQMITVTASNAFGAATNSLTVTTKLATDFVHFPMIIFNPSPAEAQAK